MAVAFADATANYFSRSSSLISASDPRPMTFHVRMKSTITTHSSSPTTTHSFLSNNFNSGNPRLFFAFRNSSASNFEMAIFNGAYSISSSFTLNTTDFISYVWTLDDSGGDDLVEYFRAGVSLGTDTTTPGGVSTNGAALCTINGSNATFSMPGELADMGVWNCILTQAEIDALDAGITSDQIRPGSLISALPLIDASGSDRMLSPWTKNGTLTKADHPSIVMPSAQILQFPVAAPAAGGGIRNPFYGPLSMRSPI